MGNILSASLSCDELVSLVLRFLCGKTEYLHTLEENLEALQKKKQDLNAMRNDLLKRVSREESRGLHALPEVKEWFSKVEEIETEANYLLDDSIFQVHRLAMYGYCSQVSASTHHYIEKVLMTLKEVDTLRSKGVFELVVVRALPPLVKKMPPIQLTVSQEKLFAMAWNTLKDENVGTLCLYGMGGIGKTTLLNQIKSKVLEAGDAFDIVMFVVVGSEEVESIQKKILDTFYSGTTRDNASRIHEFLNRKRFVLLFDDLPKKVELEEIGVPLPSKRNGCKIVFTTRSREPCRRKWVDAEVEVPCLSSEEACYLFQKTLEEATLKSHQDIPKLTRVVARKCRGLPLALSVISKTMACKTMVREWHHAIHVLVSSAAESSGIEDEILPILKLSYDSLPGENIKLCFLYCALFSEYDNISKQDLVDYWTCEGIVEAEDKEIAEIKSYGVIGELVRRGLLMENENGYGVKINDVVREMALWIATDFGRQKEHFVMIKGERIEEMPVVNDWRVVRRMSVTSTQIESISDSPECTQLTTLFLKGNGNLKRISGDFFRCMTSLVLLDMSENWQLSELPEEVSCLVSLQFLNLSGSCIRRLPLGLKEVKSLIHLDLDYTYYLQGIDVIASLLNLQVLRLFSYVPMDLSLMRDIQLLKNLKELSLTVTEDAVLQRLLSIHPLASCIRRLSLREITITNGGILSLETMFSLRELDIVSCDILEIAIDWRSTIQKETVHLRNIENIPQFSNIRTVSLKYCKGVRDLTWLLFSPSLGDLSLDRCPQIEQIISREKAQLGGHTSEQPFQNLTRLTLTRLPELESIYWTPLPFPVLEYLKISGCPKLRRLPFNSQSAIGNQVEMKLDEEWIEGVEWEDEATKERFSYFINRSLPRIDRFSISRLLSGSVPIENVVVVGTKGSGKSATANSIAGKTVLNPLAHTSDGSTRCHNRYSVFVPYEPITNVIDTPSLFDLSASPEFISKEMVRCLTLAEGGIHAVLLVFSAGKQISEEEKHIVSTLQLLFGIKIFDYLIVVFTGGDKLENDQVTLDEFLRVGCPDFLKRVLKMCGNQMILFDNKTMDEAKKKQQVDRLQSLVKQIEIKNRWKPYTNEMYHMIKRETDKLSKNQKELQSKGLSEEQLAMAEKELQKSYDHKLMFYQMAKSLRLGLSEESKNDEELSLQTKMKWSLEDSQQESADPTKGFSTKETY